MVSHALQLSYLIEKKLLKQDVITGGISLCWGPTKKLWSGSVTLFSRCMSITVFFFKMITLSRFLTWSVIMWNVKNQFCWKHFCYIICQPCHGKVPINMFLPKVIVWLQKFNSIDMSLCILVICFHWYQVIMYSSSAECKVLVFKHTKGYLEFLQNCILLSFFSHLHLHLVPQFQILLSDFKYSLDCS